MILTILALWLIASCLLGPIVGRWMARLGDTAE